MPAPEPLTAEDWCELAKRWRVAPDTMKRVAMSADDYSLEMGGAPVLIISGARSPAEQQQLRRNGGRAAPDDLSTHLSCPATGVDITLGFAATSFQKVTWGRIAMMNGLRWGGGSELDDDGIPLDWQHVDRGPRH